MAKVPFSKLKLNTHIETRTLTIGDQEIIVNTYLPLKDKLSLIADVLNASADDNNFVSPIKVKACFAVFMIEYYTNISFTENQKKDISKLYDIIHSNKLDDQVMHVIPIDEIDGLLCDTMDIVENFYKYRTSALGIMESIAQDYKDLDMDATNIQQKLNDPNNMKLLKDVLSKLG